MYLEEKPASVTLEGEIIFSQFLFWRDLWLTHFVLSSEPKGGKFCLLFQFSSTLRKTFLKHCSFLEPSFDSVFFSGHWVYAYCLHFPSHTVCPSYHIHSTESVQSEFVSASTWPYPAFDSPCSLASLGLLTLLPTFFFFLEILSFLKLSIPFWLLFFTLAPCLAQCLLLIFIATSSILLSLICIAGDVTSSCSINFYITSTILSSWRSPRPLVPTYWTMPLHFHAVISVFWGTKRIIFLFIKRSHAAGELLNTMLSMNPHLISTAVIGFNMMIVLTVLWGKTALASPWFPLFVTRAFPVSPEPVLPQDFGFLLHWENAFPPSKWAPITDHVTFAPRFQFTDLIPDSFTHTNILWVKSYLN